MLEAVKVQGEIHPGVRIEATNGSGRPVVLEVRCVAEMTDISRQPHAILCEKGRNRILVIPTSLIMALRGPSGKANGKPYQFHGLYCPFPRAEQSPETEK